MKKLLAACAVTLTFSLTFFFPSEARAWNGYDRDNHSHIEIGKNNLVRKGKTIEIYDYRNGGYKDVEVTGIRSRFNSVEVEVYDRDTNQYRTFEMDKR